MSKGIDFPRAAVLGESGGLGFCAAGGGTWEVWTIESLYVTVPLGGSGRALGVSAGADTVIKLSGGLAFPYPFELI